jgi:Protein of unknown function (DUF1565).
MQVVKQLGVIVMSLGLMLIISDRIGAAPSNIIHVNPIIGNDQTADGTETNPYKTITAALRQQRQATIKLADGTYSTNTGESFPLTVPAEVILLGNEANKGATVLIQGGGNFRSLFLGQQNVAVVLQDRAQLRGVTVTNSNPRGFGVWIEKGSPTISGSTIANNTQDGISITGQASGVVSNNVLLKNGANGITIDGLATPEIRQNMIAENGFGISVRQNSAPQITGNQILHSQDGIIIQGQARPLLRNNQITGNRRTGVVVLARAIPDLGTASHLGQNVFANNGEKDLHNAGAYPTAANGNQIDASKTAGNIDFQAQKLAIGYVPPTNNSANAAPVVSLLRPPNLPASSDSVIVSLNGNPPPVSGAILPNLPPIAAVPPKGEPVNQPIIIAPPRPIVANAPPARWRLVVPLVSANTLNQVRALFPDAFASNRNGRSVVQVGAYSDRNMALQRLQQLAEIGLQGEIEHIIR